MSIMRYQVIIDDISHNYIIILTFHLIVDLVSHNLDILCHNACHTHENLDFFSSIS